MIIEGLYIESLRKALMQSIFNQVLCILITIQHYHVGKSPKQVLLCCIRLLNRLVNLQINALQRVYKTAD